jgi:transcriptional regulator with XRE-family HTH domain
MAGLTTFLSNLLVRTPRKTRTPSVKQMLKMAYTRSGKLGHRTWRKVAKDLGVAESTLRRWRHGDVPSAAKLAHLRDITAVAKEKKVRRRLPSDQAVVIDWSFDGRDRSTPGANLNLSPGTMRAVQEAFISGEPQRATRLFIAGIGDPWYQAHFAAHQQIEENKEIERKKEQGMSMDDIDMVDDFYDDLTYEDAIVEDDDYGFTVQGAY